ncbi:MAG: tRNA lysidine(34) synthetase TilS [SAR324 cluster bacterium]|nr:tRNA lysidine(34) synthetase TilS [SAR324 cluster bacterium]
MAFPNGRQNSHHLRILMNDENIPPFLRSSFLLLMRFLKKQ